MGLKGLFRRNAAVAPDKSPAAPPVPAEPLPPEVSEELGKAWEELAAAAKESGVNSVQACSRSGAPWEKDPAVVRAIAATVRSLPNLSTGERGPGTRA